jgi:polyhydroxybutyrate depolymerase
VNRRKIAIGAAVLLLGLPALLVMAAYAFFYSVFYFPNRSNAIAGRIVSSGDNRDYLLYIPPSYNRARPAPLVITLHSSMSWPTSAMNISHWNQVAEEQGVIVVYPSGTGLGPKSWEMTGSDTPLRMPDVIFISDLIDSLEASYNIDRTRIYVNGMSNGAGMTFVLSCTLTDRIAAVGMVSTGLDPDWNWCQDHTPVPVIAFHGTADPVCPYDGGPSRLAGGSFPSIRGTIANWSRRNQCRPDPIESTVAANVTRLEYPGCAEDADVVLYTIKGGGHQWPGGEPVVAQWMVGPYSHDIDATRQMWAFFSQHQLARK